MNSAFGFERGKTFDLRSVGVLGPAWRNGKTSVSYCPVIVRPARDPRLWIIYGLHGQQVLFKTRFLCWRKYELNKVICCRDYFVHSNRE